MLIDACPCHAAGRVHRWAEPDEVQLRQALRSAITHTEVARGKAQAACQGLPRRFSPEAVATRAAQLSASHASKLLLMSNMLPVGGDAELRGGA